MKWALLAALALYDAAPPAVPMVRVEASALSEREGVTYRAGVPFSGFSVGALSETPYVEGRAHGLSLARYPGGALRFRRLYRAGKREGVHEGFWPNGQLQFTYRYVEDLFEGEQRAYHANGVLAELRHYRAGHEEGLQRFFDETGRIIANYTFKDGRRYGIVGRSDCVSR